MPELDGRPADVTDRAPLALVNFGHFTTMVVDDGRVRGSRGTPASCSTPTSTPTACVPSSAAPSAAPAKLSSW